MKHFKQISDELIFIVRYFSVFEVKKRKVVSEFLCLFFGSWSCEIQFFCVLFTEFCCLHVVFLYNPHELVTVHLIKASCCLGGILMSLTTCIFFFFCSWTNMWKNKKLLQLSFFRRRSDFCCLTFIWCTCSVHVTWELLS